MCTNYELPIVCELQALSEQACMLGYKSLQVIDYMYIQQRPEKVKNMA